MGRKGGRRPRRPRWHDDGAEEDMYDADETAEFRTLCEGREEARLLWYSLDRAEKAEVLDVSASEFTDELTMALSRKYNVPIDRSALEEPARKVVCNAEEMTVMRLVFVAGVASGAVPAWNDPVTDTLLRIMENHLLGAEARATLSVYAVRALLLWRWLDGWTVLDSLVLSQLHRVDLARLAAVAMLPLSLANWRETEGVVDTLVTGSLALAVSGSSADRFATVVWVLLAAAFAYATTLVRVLRCGLYDEIRLILAARTLASVGMKCCVLYHASAFGYLAFALALLLNVLGGRSVAKAAASVLALLLWPMGALIAVRALVPDSMSTTKRVVAMTLFVLLAFLNPTSSLFWLGGVLWQSVLAVLLLAPAAWFVHVTALALRLGVWAVHVGPRARMALLGLLLWLLSPPAEQTALAPLVRWWMGAGPAGPDV